MQQTQNLQLYDIYDVYYNPWFLQSWFLGLCCAMVLCLSGYVVYRWYVNRKKIEKAYWERALETIHLLEMAETSNQSQKEFYDLLTAAFKEYIAERFQIHSISTATDQEFLVALEKEPTISKWIYHDAQQIFEGLMFVKFARGQAGLDRMIKDVKLFKAIVLKTVPQNL